MKFEDWDTRWSEGRIGFHEGTANALLTEHVGKLGQPGRVLVPLAGKAVDMRFLASKGHDVVGVEFVQTAIDDFFKELGKQPTAHRLGAHDAYYADGITLVRADFFDVSAASLGRFNAIYDRAALVAIDPARREDYVRICSDTLQPGGKLLLITFSYDQAKMPGPPFSVDTAAVHTLYTGKRIDTLATRRVPNDKLGSLDETLYCLHG